MHGTDLVINVSGSATDAALIFANGTTAKGYVYSNNNGLLEVAAGGTNQNVSIKPSGSGYTIINGNVGIGTTGPGVKTHIYNASGRTDLRVESAGGDGNYATLQVKGGGSNAWWTIFTNDSAIGGAVDNLVFYKEGGAAGAKMVIQNNGNVGIGTTAPVANLQIGNDADAGIRQIQFENVGWAGHRAAIRWDSGKFSLDRMVNSGLSVAVNALTIDYVNGGNVGIGTTNPGNKLEVKDDSTWITNKISGAGTVGVGTMFSPTGTGGLNWYLQASANSATIGGGKFGILGNDAVARMVIQDNGNVGIGTTGPTARLGVIGADSLSTSFAANISGATGTGLVVTNNGNVGIGTTVPDAKLFVVGAGAGPASLRIGYNDTSVNYFNADIQYFRKGDNTNVLTINQGNVGIGTTAPTDSNSFGGKVLDVAGPGYFRQSTDATKYISIGTSGGDSFLEAHGTGNNFRFITTIGDVMKITNAGNVGIGTMAPGAKMELSTYPNDQTTTDVGLALTNGAGSSGKVLPALVWAYTGVGSNIYGGIDMVRNSGTAGDMRFFANSSSGSSSVTPQMVIQGTSGNVGIGTTGPVDKLTVNGDIAFHYGDTSGYGNNATIGNISAYSTLVAPSAGVTAAEIRFLTGTATYGKGQIAFYTNNVDSTATAATEVMRIKENGNVGIGTTGPLTKFVVSKAGAEGLEIEPGSASNITMLQAYNRSGSVYNQIDFVGSSFDFKSYPGAYQGLHQDTLGNVGIGTTGPGNLLSVRGSANFGIAANSYGGNTDYGALSLPRGQIVYSETNTNNQMYLMTNGHWTASNVFDYSNTGQTAAGIGIYSGTINFFTDPSGTAGVNLPMNNRMTIINNGNVGIGTTGPNVALQVGSVTGVSTIVNTQSLFSNNVYYDGGQTNNGA
ncbi:MAG: hypothetical protein NTV03_02010, partial [Candidatus Nomurabacteria bacterium]|nr:hypothetical protein [Candidatus Nomurabacteria bacterium]